MLASKWMRFVPKVSARTIHKKLSCNRMTDYELFESVIVLSTGGGAIMGSGYGIYNGYLSHRQASYPECAFQTTLYGVVCTGYGACVGALFGWLAPVLITICCVCVPVAGGAVIVKYFDKNAKPKP